MWVLSLHSIMNHDYNAWECLIDLDLGIWLTYLYTPMYQFGPYATDLSVQIHSSH